MKLKQDINIDTTKLLKALCSDLDIHFSTVEYLCKRLAHEGISFLTVTLPKLGALLLEALEFNNLSALKSKYSCFQWKSGAPLHFKRLTDRIFDVSGCVRVDADEVAIWQLRQLSQYFYKLALDFTDEQLSDAEASFIKVEEEVAAEDYDIPFVEKIRKNVESFYNFPKYEHVLQVYRPRNGPGTFAGLKATLNLDSDGAKFNFATYKASVKCYNTCLERYRAISGYFRPYPASHEPIGYKKADTAEYSETLFVPKDSRGPRVIMREPLHSLQLQMSFFDWFSNFLEKSTKNHINFTDQSINRRLAEHGSINGSWATIDLKEASDRVSYSVVKRIARNIPVLNWFLKNCRTSKTKLPSGKIMNLSKLAGMGSGLTFTWLSFLIHAAVATEISVTTGTTFGAASRHVYTYGDDLIVPVCYVEEAKRALKKVTLVINDKKSFYRKSYNITRCFRESCGGDYYGGADVSIARLKLQNCSLQVARRILKVSGSQAIVMVSEHAGETQLNGLNAVSSYLYKELEVCTGPLPIIGKRGSVIGRLTRNYVAYPVDKTGTYQPLKVICAVPVLLEEPRTHELFKVARALTPKDGSPLGYLDGDSTVSNQFEHAVPRTVKYTIKRVSSLSVMR